MILSGQIELVNGEAKSGFNQIKQIGNLRGMNRTITWKCTVKGLNKTGILENWSGKSHLRLIRNEHCRVEQFSQHYVIEKEQNCLTWTSLNGKRLAVLIVLQRLKVAVGVRQHCLDLCICDCGRLHNLRPGVLKFVYTATVNNENAVSTSGHR